jgi:predicted nucleic-acid-binding protein
MAVAIDTNVLVRYIVKDDIVLAHKAEQIIGQAKTAGLLLDRLIIAEISYVLRSVYKLSKDDIVAVYRGLLSNDRFSIPDRELVEMTVDSFARERSLSFEDCWLLILHRSGRAVGIATFDSGLSRRIS